MSHPKLAFPSADGDCTPSRMMNPYLSCTFTGRVPICWGDREELLISPLTTHLAPNNMQYSSTGKKIWCFMLLCFCFLIILDTNFTLGCITVFMHYCLSVCRLVEFTRADGTLGRRVRPYIIDLGSGNGTYLNNQRIEAQRYYELKEKDVIKFGFSSREYVLLHEFSDTTEVDAKHEEEDDEGLDE